MLAFQFVFATTFVFTWALLFMLPLSVIASPVALLVDAGVMFPRTAV